MFLRSIFIFFVLFAVAKNSDAQVSDSLYKALPDSLKPADRAAFTEKEKINLFRNITIDVVEIHQTELTALVNQFDKKIQSGGNRSDRVYGNAAIANYYVCIGDYGTAQDFYKKVVSNAGNDKEYNLIVAEAYVRLAGLVAAYMQSEAAMDYLLKALENGDQKDADFMDQIYNAYQMIYIAIDQDELFLEYSEKRLALIPASQEWTADNYVTYLDVAQAMQCVYDQNKDLKYADSSEVIIRKVMAATKSEPQNFYASCYFMLGRTAYWKNENKEAVAYFDSALLHKYLDHDLYATFRFASQTKLLRSISLIKLGDKDAVKAVDTMQIFKKDFFSLKLKNQILYENAKETGDWKKAFEYYEKYIEYNDSLDLRTNQGRILVANQKYSVSQKEVQIKSLENTNLKETATKNKIAGAAVIASVILLSLIALLYARNKRQQAARMMEAQKLSDELTKMEQDMTDERAMQAVAQEKIITEQRQEISQNMHDEISSSLAALRYYVADLRNKATDAQAKNALGNVEEETAAIYLQARDFMHQLNKAKVAPDNYNVVVLLQNLSDRFNDESLLKINNKFNGDEIANRFTTQQHYEMYLIIKESIANIIKHANATQVNITISIDQNTCSFIIADNGKGFDTQKVENGLGMQGINNRVKALNGSLSITSKNTGTILSGDFPVNA